MGSPGFPARPESFPVLANAPGPRVSSIRKEASVLRETMCESVYLTSFFLREVLQLRFVRGEGWEKGREISTCGCLSHTTH